MKHLKCKWGKVWRYSLTLYFMDSQVQSYLQSNLISISRSCSFCYNINTIVNKKLQCTEDKICQNSIKSRVLKYIYMYVLVPLSIRLDQDFLLYQFL